MTAVYEIRAKYDRETITVYQAYSPSIADVALKLQRFAPPFSFQRMTWIKPSFLWLMYRSNWGQKANQQRILAVSITRSGWEKALSLGTLTHPEPSVFRNATEWESQFANAPVHVQWDTERSLRGAALNHFSIQVGIGRELIQEYVDEWVVKIEDITSNVAKIRDFIKSGNEQKAKQHLPVERVYSLEPRIGKRILV